MTTEEMLRVEEAVAAARADGFAAGIEAAAKWLDQFNPAWAAIASPRIRALLDGDGP